MRFSRALFALSAASTILALPAAIGTEELVARQEPEAPAAPVDVPPTPSVDPAAAPVAETPAPSDAAPSEAPIEITPSSSASEVAAASSDTPSPTESTPTSSAPSPSESIFEQDGQVGTVITNEDGWLIYRPMDRSTIEARAVEDAFNLFPEVPLFAEPSAAADTSAEDDGFTLSNSERIKRGLKPRRPAKLWSGRAPATRPVNQFVPRQQQHSAIRCSTNAAVPFTCPDKSICFLANPDCTQITSPAQAATGEGAGSCFAQCPQGGCVVAAFTNQGQCLVFTQSCCA